MSPLPDGIRHVVVLMLENRSFDHLLGRLTNVDGPAGRSNVDPRDGTAVPVTFDATPTSPALPDPAKAGQLVGDPHHDFVSVNRQLFETATPAPGTPVTCGGFVAAGRESGDPDADRIAREVMRCFDAPAQLTTMSALAKEFVVCDRWFASVPGPTWPNRLFVHAATSFGVLDNTFRLYSGPTLYDRLDAARVDWAIYYHDIPQSLCLPALAERRDRQGRPCVRSVTEFFKDVRGHRVDAPTLPSYVFIEPAYFEPSHTVFGRIVDGAKALAHWLGFPVQPSLAHANDQHAPHDVRLGEHLIADVYDALRGANEVWSHCLFIVLHDEHGGLYEHVPPPAAINPDGKHSADPSFGFDRAGLRVPAILVSPYLRPGVDSTPYEHTSIVRTVREHFCPGALPLTARDAAAAPISPALFAPSPRSDAPRRSARPRPVFAMRHVGDAGARPLNDLQTTLVHLAASGPPGSPAAAATTPEPPAPPGEAAPVSSRAAPSSPAVATEAQGHAFVTRQMAGLTAARAARGRPGPAR